MFRFRTLAIAGCILAATALLGRAQDDDVKAVLNKAIEAHGGAKNLTKYKGTISKFKGTIEIAGKSRDITGETTMLKPDKFKHAMTLDIDGMQIPIAVVYNGKKMWRSVNDKTDEIKDEKTLSETREALLAEGGASFVDYLKAPYELGALGEVKIKDKAAIGIRVSKKGQRDVSYFFDKKTHLLVKTEMRVHDEESGQEVNQEKYIIGYRDTDGLKTGARVIIHKDGTAFMDIEITESKVYEKLEESNFAMP
jgi:outer membrane lipoprotein-sorting protein